MAAVKKLPSGNYQVRWLTPEGLSRKKTFRLKADADRHAGGIMSSNADGVYIDSPPAISLNGERRCGH